MHKTWMIFGSTDTHVTSNFNYMCIYICTNRRDVSTSWKMNFSAPPLPWKKSCQRPSLKEKNIHVHVRAQSVSASRHVSNTDKPNMDSLLTRTCTIMYVFSVNHGRWQDLIQGGGRCRKIIYFSGGAHIMPVRICTCKFEVTWVSVLPKIIHVLWMLAVKFSHWAPCINFSSALLYRLL